MFDQATDSGFSDTAVCTSSMGANAIVSASDSSTPSPRDSANSTVLYVGGFGRSGSTLLERVVQASPQAISLGEVVHLWKRGVIGDELCGCGTKFSECPFWQAVGERAFGGWGTVDVDEILALQYAVDRQRHVWKTMRPFGVTRETILRYTSYYRAVYRAAAEVSGADLVVDSSKHASLAIALSNDKQIDLRVLHLIRDSVAVTYSWSKEVSYIAAGQGRRNMRAVSVPRASALWMSNNALVQLVRLAGKPTYQLRYEDFVRAPTATIQHMWKALGLPGSYNIDLSQEGGIILERSHSIGGNRMRFKPGPLIIRADEAWRVEMPARQRRAVKVLTFPVRSSFGYIGRYK